jgi:hypothetical protein
VVLKEILGWTGGQPFLTQRLCQLLVDGGVAIESGQEVAQVVALVRSQVIDHWESQDHQEHLKTIRQRVLAQEQRAGYLLELYGRICREGGFGGPESARGAAVAIGGVGGEAGWVAPGV